MTEQEAIDYVIDDLKYDEAELADEKARKQKRKNHEVPSKDRIDILEHRIKVNKVIIQALKERKRRLELIEAYIERNKLIDGEINTLICDNIIEALEECEAD
jgi:phage terminase Nu1 subunit (DNA packaging protein)